MTIEKKIYYTTSQMHFGFANRGSQGHRFILQPFAIDNFLSERPVFWKTLILPVVVGASTGWCWSLELFSDANSLTCITWIGFTLFLEVAIGHLYGTKTKKGMKTYSIGKVKCYRLKVCHVNLTFMNKLLQIVALNFSWAFLEFGTRKLKIWRKNILPFSSPGDIQMLFSKDELKRRGIDSELAIWSKV